MRYLFFLLFSFTTATSQVGIGTTTPEGALDINSINNGLLIPRVSLISVDSQLPVVNPQGGSLKTGTIVWNTVANGLIPNNVVPGYYYWDGIKWKFLDNKTSISSFSKSQAFIPKTGKQISQTNDITQGINGTTTYKSVNFSGLSGIVTSVECIVDLEMSLCNEMDLYLQSPSGKIIELCTDNGGTGAVGLNIKHNVTYSDDGTNSITSWTSGSLLGGVKYRPEGTLISSGGVVPTIQSMADFYGDSPNGVWTLIVRDDTVAGSTATHFLNFNSFKLNLIVSEFFGLDYRLVSQNAVLYKSGTNVCNFVSYSANPKDDEGFLIALTRTSSPVASTSVSSLPGVLLHSNTSSPLSGVGNFWTSSNIISIDNDNSLSNDQYYYYQLWSKGNISTPLLQNEIYSFLSSLIQ